jgi:hypothetical protein
VFLEPKAKEVTSIEVKRPMERENRPREVRGIIS